MKRLTNGTMYAVVMRRSDGGEMCFAYTDTDSAAKYIAASLAQSLQEKGDDSITEILILTSDHAAVVEITDAVGVRTVGYNPVNGMPQASSRKIGF